MGHWEDRAFETHPTHFEAFLSCPWLPLPGREELRWEVQDASFNGTDVCVRCACVTGSLGRFPRLGLSSPSLPLPAGKSLGRGGLPHRTHTVLEPASKKPAGAGSPPALSRVTAQAAGLGDPCAKGVPSSLEPPNKKNTDFLQPWLFGSPRRCVTPVCSPKPRSGAPAPSWVHHAATGTYRRHPRRSSQWAEPLQVSITLSTHHPSRQHCIIPSHPTKQAEFSLPGPGCRDADLQDEQIPLTRGVP